VVEEEEVGSLLVVIYLHLMKVMGEMVEVEVERQVQAHQLQEDLALVDKVMMEEIQVVVEKVVLQEEEQEE
jgi:hypothetical protein